MAEGVFPRALCLRAGELPAHGFLLGEHHLARRPAPWGRGAGRERERESLGLDARAREQQACDPESRPRGGAGRAAGLPADQGFSRGERPAHRERASRRGLRWHRRFDPTHGVAQGRDRAAGGGRRARVPGAWTAQRGLAGTSAARSGSVHKDRSDRARGGAAAASGRRAALARLRAQGAQCVRSPDASSARSTEDEGSGHGGGARAGRARSPGQCGGAGALAAAARHRERRRVHHPRGRNGLREPDLVAERLRTAALDRAPRAAHAGRGQGRT